MKTYFRTHLAATLMLALCTSTSSFAASNPASTDYVDELIQATIAQLTYTAGYGITIDNNVISATAGHAIGDTYQGGTIFYLDSASSGQHGLIASVSDYGSFVRYGASANELAVGDGIYAGISNTDAIRSYQASQGDTADSAALACLTYAIQADGITACDQTSSAAAGANCYADWYLPSKFELLQLALQATAVGLTDLTEYWSSTQVDATDAYSIFIQSTLVFDTPSKSKASAVRCIRAF
ncbi:MAG: hypothetical protein P1U39_02755 [Legionellaceae bacterium]|nr:hypothetical protein [Legionellaceae bacterium]